MPKVIYLRFYEELNDFLPRKQKKLTFEHEFHGNPNIKDIIESVGVPHTEVEIILANGHSVDFNYRPLDRDRISVYPVFESLDITPLTRLRPEPLRVTRFIADVHLGRLGRSLRMLGFDTLMDESLDDHDLVRVAGEENRILLTRDIALLKNGSLSRGYWVRSNLPDRQVEEVVERLDLGCQIQAFRRCMNCNGIISPVSKEAVVHLLEPMTAKHFNEFFQCKDCMKVYWKGSHYEKMMKKIASIAKHNPPTTNH